VQRLSSVVLAFLVACSAKSPNNSSDSPRPNGPNVAQAPAPAPGKGGTMQVPSANNLPPPDPREAALSEIVTRLIEKEHVLRKKLDDDVSRNAFKMYIDHLDGGKMFLLEEDKTALAKHVDKMDDELKSGRLDIAHEGAKIFANRVAMVEKIVASVLSAPMDFTNEEYVEIDPDKLQLAKDEAELKDRWRRRLELEVMERVSGMEARLDMEKDKQKKQQLEKKKPLVKDAKGNAGSAAEADKDAKDDEDVDKAMPLAQIPKTPEEREAKARADIAKTYSGRFARLKNPGPLDAAADMINAIAAALDPHTNYLPPAEKANFDIQMSGTLEGIGAVLREKEHLIEIVELVPGGASWRQGGLAAGDLILSVAEKGKDPVDVFDMRIDEVVKMIRGPKNTVVRLRVQKAAGHEETIEITRDVVVIEEAYAKGAVLNRKTGGPSWGYIHLPSFYGGKGNPHTAAGDVKKLFGEMKKRGVAGVVLDIRGNGGGYLNDAVDMTGALIDEGPVVQIQDSHGQKEVLSDDDKGTAYDGPVIVLVDQFSASASEILAGALQDYNRALIVGASAQTHGKGTVQTVADLDRATGGKIELGVFKITIQQFFRVSGSSTQREGVKPDVVLPNPAGHIESGEKELPNAIAWSQIKPAPHNKLKPSWVSSVLAQRSASRVAKNALLAKISTTTDVLKARRNDTKVPLQKAAWEKRRKDMKAALDAASPDLKKAPSNFLVKPIGDVPPSTPGPGGKSDDRASRWSDNIAKDPWLDECVNILGDMAAK
jgi:carboxyl-terminal processing protease